jgi:hypothetical protein
MYSHPLVGWLRGLNSSALPYTCQTGWWVNLWLWLVGGTERPSFTPRIPYRGECTPVQEQPLLVAIGLYTILE